MSDFLPPAVLRLAADISDYTAKLAEAAAELQAFADSIPDTLDRSAASAGPAGHDAGKVFADGMSEGVHDGLADVGDGVSRDVSDRLRDEKGRFVSEGDKIGENLVTGARRGVSGRIGTLVNDLFGGIGRAISGTGIGKVAAGIGSALSASLKPALIAVGVGAGAQLVAGLLPAVGAIALMPAGILAAVTALGTLKTALSGVGDAVSAGMSGDIDNYTAALARLAPAAQSAVRAIVGLKPQLDRLKATVQGDFFQGFGASIKTLGAEYLPVLRKELGATATGLNQTALSFGRMLSAPGIVMQTDNTLQNLAVTVAEVSRIVPGIAEGFLSIANVGSQYLPQLASGFQKAGDYAAKFMHWFADSGNLDTFIQGGITALREIGGLLRDVGSIVQSVFSAMSSTGSDALGILGLIVHEVAKFLASAQGVQLLNTVFQLLAVVANEVGSLLIQVLPIAAQLITNLATAVTPIIGLLISQLLPVVVQLAGALGGALGQALRAATPLILAILQALIPMVPILVPIVNLIGAFFGVIADHQSLQALAFGILAVVAAFKLWKLATELWSGVTKAAILVQEVFDAVMMANPIGLIILAIVGLVAAFAYLWTHSASFRDFWIAIWSAIKTAAVAVAHAVVTAVKAVGDFFVALGHDIASIASAIGHFFTDTIPGWINSAVGFFESLPGRLLSALKKIPGLINQALHAVAYAIGYGIGLWVKEMMAFPGQVWSILKKLWTTAVQLVAAGIDAVVSFFEKLPGRVLRFMNAMYDGVTGLATRLWHDVVTATEKGFNAVVGFFQKLPGRVSAFFNAAKDAALTAASALFHGVLDFFEKLPGRVTSALNTMVKAIGKAFAGAGKWLYQAGKDIVNGLINGIKDMASKAWDEAKSLGGSVAKGFKDALKIGSPSKVFDGLAGDTVAGFVQGIKRNSRKAASAVASMLAIGSGAVRGPLGGLALGGSLSPSLSLGPSLSGGAQTITLQNNLTLLIDGKQVHARLIGPSQQYKLRTGTTGLS